MWGAINTLDTGNIPRVRYEKRAICLVSAVKFKTLRISYRACEARSFASSGLLAYKCAIQVEQRDSSFRTSSEKKNLYSLAFLCSSLSRSIRLKLGGKSGGRKVECNPANFSC